MSLKDLFEKSKQDEINRIENEAKSNTFVDDRIVQMKPGHQYSFRLMYPIDPKTNKPLKHPFINRKDHSYFDEVKKQRFEVVCPSTEYLLSGKVGYFRCAICQELRKMKPEADAGSKSAKATYDRLRRKDIGYALVYVVSNPTKPETNGTFMILRYKYTIMEFLKRKVYGIDMKTGKQLDIKTIGFEAFDLENGLNLDIDVTLKGEYPQYSCEFSRDYTSVPVTQEDVLNATKALKFVDDFYKSSTDEDIAEFVVEAFNLDFDAGTTDDNDSNEESAPPPPSKPTPPATPTTPPPAPKVEKKPEAKVEAPPNPPTPPPAPKVEEKKPEAPKKVEEKKPEPQKALNEDEIDKFLNEINGGN